MLLNKRALFKLSLLAAGSCTSCAPFDPTAPRGLPPKSPEPGSVTRLEGIVQFQGVPIEGAVMQVYDIASGQTLPLFATEQSQGKTDPAGRFTLLVPSLPAHRILKIVAASRAGAWGSLVDGRGNVLRPYSSRKWRLNAFPNDRSVYPSLAHLELTPSTTAATQIMEGPLQLQFRLKPNLRDLAVPRLFSDTNQLLIGLDLALESDEAAAEKIVRNANQQGYAKNKWVLSNAITVLGLLEGWNQHIVGLMQDFSRQVDVFTPFRELESDLAALSPASFPIGRLSRDPDGNIQYADADGRVIDGIVLREPLEETVSMPTPTAPETLPATAIPILDIPEDPGSESLASGSLSIRDGTLLNPLASEVALP
ncbi:MAG: hypothetical protein VKN33_08675 [Candidatus Sericytochromatia bacterium]|nr:hypothetical protein [Candidatus Sericytochromatia bacterium]